MFGGKLNKKEFGMWGLRKQDGPSGVVESSCWQVISGGVDNVIPYSKTCLS